LERGRLVARFGGQTKSSFLAVMAGPATRRLRVGRLCRAHSHEDAKTRRKGTSSPASELVTNGAGTGEPTLSGGGGVGVAMRQEPCGRESPLPQVVVGVGLPGLCRSGRFPPTSDRGDSPQRAHRVSHRLAGWLVVVGFSLSGWGLSGCGAPPAAGPAVPVPSGPIVLFVAASLSDVVRELTAAYRTEHPETEFTVSGASSSSLARQIEAGAPAHLFLSADTDWAQKVAGTRPRSEMVSFVGNRLVVIVPARAAQMKIALQDLATPGFGRIALANPEGIPAGRYAKQALQTAGVWESVAAKIIPADDVRQAVAYVERGEVDAAIVYATDVRGKTDGENAPLRVIAEIDEALHPPVRYGFVLLDRDDREAKPMFDWLQSPSARTVFEAHGFLVLP
jgi:molybdate transport system substrate-binding protein